MFFLYVVKFGRVGVFYRLSRLHCALAFLSRATTTMLGCVAQLAERRSCGWRTYPAADG